MRVALDATPLTVSTGGIRRYTIELIGALAAAYPADEFLLASDQRFAAPDGAQVMPGPRNSIERRWWLFGLALRPMDLFHGTDFAVPYLPLRPSVQTIHDLSPWAQTGWRAASERVRRRAPVLAGLGIATMIITPTETVRRQVIERWRIASDRVIAVPEAAAARFRPTARAEPRPYFLYVGALEPRKNTARLVDAWREVARTHAVDLILVGRARDGYEPPAAQPGLRLTGELPDEDLPALYSGAVACLYPSLYEGFGLPVLEAMQCGSAVITSLDPAVSEVAGTAALAVDAHDSRGWRDAMIALLTRPDYLAHRRWLALRRAASFSWARTAGLTCEVYHEAIRRFGR